MHLSKRQRGDVEAKRVLKTLATGRVSNFSLTNRIEMRVFMGLIRGGRKEKGISESFIKISLY